MRVVIIARPKFPVPPEQFPALHQRFVAFWEQHRADFEAAYFFAGGDGGLAILNAPDEAALHQIMLEWPFTPFSALEVRPLLDIDTALQQQSALLQQMAGGAPPTA